MMFLYCEGFDYDFEVTIYDRYIDDYKDKVAIGKVIVVEGRAMIDPNYNRRAISLMTANLGSLTQVRAQARDMELLDNSIRKSLLGTNLEKEEEFEEKLDEKISENKEIKPEMAPEETKYVIKIPSTAKKDDLGKLKNFLTTQKPGGTGVFILLPS